MYIHVRSRAQQILNSSFIDSFLELGFFAKLY